MNYPKLDYLILFKRSRLIINKEDIHDPQSIPYVQLTVFPRSNMTWYQFSPVEHLKSVIMAYPKLEKLLYLSTITPAYTFEKRKTPRIE